MRKIEIIIEKNETRHVWHVYTEDTNFFAIVDSTDTVSGQKTPKVLRTVKYKTDPVKIVDEVIESIDIFINKLTNAKIRDLLMEKWGKKKTTEPLGLRYLKSLKQQMINDISGTADKNERYKAIAVIELKIAILEIERGEHLKSVSNLHSSEKFLSLVSESLESPI